jgi:hypothetical protein
MGGDLGFVQHGRKHRVEDALVFSGWCFSSELLGAGDLPEEVGLDDSDLDYSPVGCELGFHRKLACDFQALDGEPEDGSPIVVDYFGIVTVFENRGLASYELLSGRAVCQLRLLLF